MNPTNAKSKTKNAGFQELLNLYGNKILATNWEWYYKYSVIVPDEIKTWKVPALKLDQLVEYKGLIDSKLMYIVQGADLDNSDSPVKIPENWTAYIYDLFLYTGKGTEFPITNDPIPMIADEDQQVLIPDVDYMEFELDKKKNPDVSDIKNAAKNIIQGGNNHNFISVDKSKLPNQNVSSN